MLNATNDVIFKKLFGEPKNQDLLKDLLEGIFPQLDIHTVKVNKDVSLTRRLITDKLGILDVVAILNNDTKVNIEMQVKNYYDIIDRSVFYNTGMYHEDLQTGNDYGEAKRSISIWITTFNIFQEGPFYETARLRRDFENRLLTDKFELHYIQLPKFQKERKQISTKLDEWLTFILKGNTEEIRMSKNPKIKKAVEELDYLTGDEATRRIAELREKGIRDEMAALKKARREGIETRRKERTRRTESKKVVKSGVKENAIVIAKKMLADNLNMDMIMKYTGLTKEEIENLK